MEVDMDVFSAPSAARESEPVRLARRLARWLAVLMLAPVLGAFAGLVLVFVFPFAPFAGAWFALGTPESAGGDRPQPQGGEAERQRGRKTVPKLLPRHA
jgi:hypothetical protein